MTLSLGYTYRHIPFHSPRTASGQSTTSLRRISRHLLGLGARLERRLAPDIYDFLGFNEHFRSRTIPPDEKLDEVEVGLSDDVLREQAIHSLSELQAFVRQCVAVRPDKDTPALVKLRLTGGRNFIGMIHDGIPAYPDGLDLRRIYFQTRRRRPWSQRFPNGRVRTVVHMRQGDTAVVKTPWETYIPLRLRGSGSTFTEHPTFSDIPGNLMQVSDFHLFVSELSSHFDKGAFSNLFFSDGFDRSFQVLGRQIDRLQLPPDRTEALLESRQGYDRREFARLANMPNSKLVIGESARQLCSLVHSALTADLIIIGPQQRMVPKLLANYCPHDAMPLVIALERGDHEGELERYHRMIGLHSRREKFIYVNVDDLNFGRIIDRLAQALPQLGSVRQGAMR